jgi:flagellar biosynthesis GTPase FlhF
VFSFAWDVIFKLFFALLLASFPLYVWLEHEYTYHRQSDNMRERLQALQLHVMVILIALHLQPVIYKLIQPLQSNPAVPAVEAEPSARVNEANAQQREEARSREAEAKKLDASVQDRDAKVQQEEASKKEERVRRLEQAHQSLVDIDHLVACVHQMEAEAKMLDVAIKRNNAVVLPEAKEREAKVLTWEALIQSGKRKQWTRRRGESPWFD